jgi:hypothetical protein
VLAESALIVKWHRMRSLFRACHFFCEIVQKRRQLGIRVFFIFERCEHNKVLVADIRIVYLRFAEAAPD